MTVIEVPKDANVTHPYIQKDVIEQLKKALPDESASKLNQYSIRALLFKNKIRNAKPSQYHHYIEKPPTHKYSDKLIALL